MESNDKISSITELCGNNQQIVCNSQIEVNVKVKVQKTGRGDY